MSDPIKSDNARTLALSMIKQLKEIEEVNDKELTRLKKIENKNFSLVGRSVISFHLDALAELVSKI